MILLSTIFKGSASFWQGNLQIVVQTQSFVGQSRCFALFPEDQVAKDIGIRVFVSKKKAVATFIVHLKSHKEPLQEVSFRSTSSDFYLLYEASGSSV